MRLIDADAITSSNELATKIVSHNLTPYIKVDDLINFIDRLPTIEAVEVVRGEWEEITDDWNYETIYSCSVCKEDFVTIDGTPTENLYNFCPNCGADMRKGEKA